MGVLIGEKDWQGKCAAPEVILESATWLKNVHDINIINLGVNIENKRAIKAYEKIGFKVVQGLINTNKKSIKMKWIMT